ncbi:hypothetical protein HBN50_06950 [Halobacteriovorax sp. GB3]|uniref:hypothetical protein n=1 Tax=Halobacteriovorax sp. GB3 TaxID=2719615 RepID=UPI002362A43C|nr:hypothetical protein [Halobacteriovorax sp. GB3]MDD0852825.1 hypothetical protein [Halobacteriovorax sp. GB3]
MFSLFKKLTIDEVKEKLSKLSLDEYQWLSLSINEGIKFQDEKKKTFQLIGKKSFTIELKKINSELKLTLDNQNLTIAHDNEVTFNFDQFLNESISSFIDRKKECLNEGNKDVLDFEGETKAHEWIRVSFEVLKRALEEAKKKEDLLVEYRLFMGRRPNSNENLIRLLAYNLDITYHFRSNGDLQVIIYNDKNASRGSAKEPSLSVIFKAMKNQAYDELINLLSICAKSSNF